MDEYSKDSMRFSSSRAQSLDFGNLPTRHVVLA